MIRGVNRYCFEDAITKSNSLIHRYGGGSLPTYPLNPFALAHWMGMKTFPIVPNNQGVEFIIHKNSETGLCVEYHPKANDLHFGILYAIALEDLGFLQWGQVHKEYNWGSVLPDVQKMAATLYADELLKYCVEEEVVSD